MQPLAEPWRLAGKQARKQASKQQAPTSSHPHSRARARQFKNSPKAFKVRETRYKDPTNRLLQTFQAMNSAAKRPKGAELDIALCKSLLDAGQGCQITSSSLVIHGVQDAPESRATLERDIDDLKRVCQAVARCLVRQP